MDGYLKIAECAARWGLSARALAQRIRRGTPEAQKLFVGAPKRIREEDLELAARLLGLTPTEVGQLRVDELAARVTRLEYLVNRLLARF